MSTYAESDGAIQVERRTHPHLRAVYSDARIRIDHFFHDSSNWAGTPIDYLALRVVHEAYPDLRDALLGGYRSVRPLDAADVASLPLLFAVRMATYAAWLDTRRHTQFAKDLGPIIVDAAVDVVRRYLADELEV